MRLCVWAGPRRVLPVLVLLTFLHVKAEKPNERHYYIAAVEIDWTYSENGKPGSGPSYKKVVFREYEKGFKQAKTHPSWLGLLGPTLRAEEGEMIVVTFRNMATGPHSIHPHGVAYGKQSEGAHYFDNTSQKEKEDDVVQPNTEHVYYWEVTSDVSPQSGDPTCLTYTYVSHQDVVRDYNSGLIGTLLICKTGKQQNMIDAHQEYVFLFGIFDERVSKYKPNSQAPDNHVKYTINGYTSGSLPAGMHGFVDVKKCDGFEATRRKLTIEQKRQSREWKYYIAAEEIVWDYAPQIQKHVDEDFKHLYLKQSPTRIGPKYKKAVYYLYNNESFTERLEDKHKKSGRGLLGPVIRAQVRDIVFKNMASRPYSIYPHGLTIDKSAEGHFSLWLSGNQSHGVLPGETRTYVWRVAEEDEPLEGDARCVTRMYHSAVDTPRDIASGLIGPLLICRSQSLNVRNVQVNTADKEQHAMFAVFDENKSWYLDYNIRQYCDRSKVNKADLDFYKSNVMHTINGYAFESGPVLGFCNGEVATWHVSSVGAQDYIQTATFYGHPFMLNERTEDFLSLYPMTGETITMKMDNIGIWLMASLNSHGTTKGMRVKFRDVECYRDYQYDYSEEEVKTKETKAFSFWNPATLDDIKRQRRNRNRSPKKKKTVILRQRPLKGQSMKTKKKKQYQPQARSGLPFSPRGFNPGMTPRGTRPNVPQPVSDEQQLINSPVVIGLPRADFSDYEMYIPGEQPRHIELGGQDVTADEYEYVTYIDPYSGHDENKNLNLDETIKYFLKYSGPNVKTYFIAAEEVEWDYKSDQSMREMTTFTKVVFRGYMDSSFSTPDVRGELDEHLGILGPVIKAEVGQSIIVVFRNNANRPYSIHPNGVSYTKQSEGLSYDDGSQSWYEYDNEVQPNTTFTYSWKVSSSVGPLQDESNCRTWAYYSGVNPERDIHSGLIGPLLVCREGTLDRNVLDTREFVLLFMTFDESQSWYYEKNKNQSHLLNMLNEHLCVLSIAINGIIYNLKGLRMYTNQLVCWHLINMGSPRDFHSVHFHGQTFLHKKATSYRHAVYPLLPGSFATLEMRPTKPGLWQLETEVGFNQQNGMQTLFLVLNNDCYHPLGMESGSVKDEQITAINTRGYWGPHLARLNNQGQFNAWSTEVNNSWIQVDFQRPVVISQVATQGARQLFQTQFVDRYSISYSTDRRKWIFYKGDSRGLRKVFTGNQENSDTKRNTFFPPLIGRFIRLHPINWYNKATVRMEFYGCELDGCSVPLGMESGLIEDHHITASSTASSWYGGPWKPSFARLNRQGTINAWQAKYNDMYQWLQVELPQVKKITGIVTQGAKALRKEMYVMSYSLQYSDNGIHWNHYTDDENVTFKTFPGNTNNSDHVKNYIYPPIFSRFIRIIPRTWWVSLTMRIELLGCDFE
uniref:F5/8 type C domain-containing protein n=1 Tax=Anabas testudineus TaxID=64144 RepID=A0AAQ6IKR4_ANATE